MLTGMGRSLRSLPRLQLTLERLEERTVPSAGWGNFAHDPQHTGDSQVGSQVLDTIEWQTSVDLNPTGATLHYGSPVITAQNTVIVPIKTGATSGYELEAFNGGTGASLWTIPSDYTLPPSNWLPPFGPALTPTNVLYFPGNGGTVYYVTNPNTRGATISGQLAFYGIGNYNANPGAYNSTVMIDTPITADANGNIYFGFEVTGTNPSGLTGGGLARIDASGNGSYVLASTAANDSAITKVPHGVAPALSSDGTTVYVSVNNDNQNYGYLLGLDSTTLATKYAVKLMDPRNNGNTAKVLDDSTATPMVAPDGTVFYGIMGNPYNGSRGFLLHFSADLSTEYTPGAFGWDDTPSIVPTSMVPSYHGTSSYLIFAKYNNYVAGEVGSTGGDGVNEVAVLDPYASEPDPRNDGDSSLQVMQEVLVMPGPSPDASWVNNGYPNAVREWCIDDTVVDPATQSILVNSEDGYVYRWNLAKNALTQAIMVGMGVGEPYTPTLIGPGGVVYAINGGTLFALGHTPRYKLAESASTDPVALNNSVSFTATVTPTTSGAIPPTGTITFTDGSTTLGSVSLTNGKAPPLKTSFSTLGAHFIMASYSGDSNYVAGSTTFIEWVRSGSTTTLTSSANPSTLGQPVTFTATVAAVGTSGTPTGLVNFLDGSTYLGSAPLNGSGQASFTISNLGAGTHHIRAVYVGDLQFVGSKSAVLTQTVNAAAATVVRPTANAGDAAAVAALLDRKSTTAPVLDGVTVRKPAPIGSGLPDDILAAVLSRPAGEPFASTRHPGGAGKPSPFGRELAGLEKFFAALGDG